jgi:hypothetical protein
MSNVLLALAFIPIGIVLYVVIAPKVRRALERRRDSEAYNWGWTEGYDVGITQAKKDPEEIRRDAYQKGFDAGWSSAIEALSVAPDEPAKPKRSRAKKIRKAEP